MVDEQIKIPPELERMERLLKKYGDLTFDQLMTRLEMMEDGWNDYLEWLRELTKSWKSHPWAGLRDELLDKVIDITAQWKD